eukprot:745735-Hanusia_phi.AAC.1
MEFAGLFGLSEEEAEETRKQHAAVQIQASRSPPLRDVTRSGGRRSNEGEGRERRRETSRGAMYVRDKGFLEVEGSSSRDSLDILQEGTLELR